jgi:serine/threonine protein kinase/tetratricopeptide (TPR) repeat protein
LRFFHAPAATLEADSVRAHLEQCEVCRAIVAGLEAEGKDRETLVDEAVDLARRPVLSAGAREVRRTSQIVNAVEVGDEGQHTVAYEAVGPVRVMEAGDQDQKTVAYEGAGPARPVLPSAETMEVFRVSSSDTAQSAGDATVWLPVGAAENGETLQLPVAPRGAGRAEKTDPTETCSFLSGDSSSQVDVSFSLAWPARRDDAEGSSSGAATLEGVTVPGYDILEELGRGGMGVVYRARHRRLRRLVALKMVLAGAHVGQVGLARFRAEAEAVAKLIHSNIVQIYETGEHEGRPYFSLEFVEGGSLDKRMGAGPTSPRAAAQFVETLARAMEVAHQHGIVHRDLKPANILLAKVDSQSSLVRKREIDSTSLPADHWSRTTVPKIADFGLAKRVDDDSSQTQSGTILGTPSYMAPEQAEGKNREIGPAADIYSLGAILYELLVGRPPFKAGNPIDTVRQVIEQEPVPPRQLEPRVPHDLETICLKCLEKDPARRFPSAAELADDLRRFVDGDPILARPTPAWERAWKWGKRRPTLVALLGVSALAVLGTVLFIVWHNVSLRGRLDMALAEERRARQREHDVVEEQRLSLLQQKGRELFDSARVAVAGRDWSSARLNLEKALTTLGSEVHMDDLREPARALLSQVERELRVEVDRRASQARLREFVNRRDEAQFLGTLYTGMDLAANLEAARTSVHRALAVYGVPAAEEARPGLDAYLTDPQKGEILGDCSQLLLILAETEAQTASGRKPPEKEQYLRKALRCLGQAGRLEAPSRAFHLRRARYLDLLGDRAGAARSEEAARGAPLDHVLDHFLMADELYRREEFGEAIKEFDQVLERKPGHFWAQYLNAICLLRQGRPAEARTLLSACLAQRADFVWLHLLRGFAHEELQAWGAADSDFQRASQLPLDENARYVLAVNRGVLRVRQERFEDAVVELRAAIEQKPNAYQAYVNLAQAYRRLDKRDLALEPLDRAIRLEPGLAHLYRLRARLYLECNEPARALSDFDRAIEREDTNSPYRVDDHVERGRLLLSVGKHAEALGSFDAALALQKDHSPAQRLRAETLFRLGRFREVIAAFDRYLEVGKPLESVYRGRGLARAELGQYPGAIDDFTKALELHPTSAVQAYRGWTHLVVDAPQLALRDFELAIELDPKNGDAYNGRGFVRAGLGHHREAIQDAADALRLGPSSPRLLYNAARIYARCPGPYRQHALELIQQALSLLPVDQRRAFWSTHVRTDAALAALRRYRLFVRLDAELSHGK